MEKQKTGVGRRKEAVTRVFVSKGSGKIIVNDKDYKIYFPLVYLQNQVERPFKTVDAIGKFDVKINAMGGGVKGQAEAAMLGISRILVEMNPDFRPALPCQLQLRCNADSPALRAPPPCGSRRHPPTEGCPLRASPAGTTRVRRSR